MTDNNSLPQQYKFSEKKVDCFFGQDFSFIGEKLQKAKTVFITDENLYAAHAEKFSGWETIVIKAGEQFKNQNTVDSIIAQLINLHADRQTFIMGIGGGVVTDIAGFVASIYMRGVKFAFAPTSILAMVDASIGGKNGIDVGVYKNLVGVIRQPEFLLYDYSFLETLPDEEWVNGFAEIIKHACIKDREMFYFLQQHSLAKFQSSLKDAAAIVERNVNIKYNVVANDEQEIGERKLLNFGHTIGHAIENTSKLPHGHAISIGMYAACKISEAINNFDASETEKIKELLVQYELPVTFNSSKEQTWEILLHDKKKSGNNMSFIALDKIGAASVRSITLDQLHQIFNSI
ncbi:MAG: 3-dehydroquinate synthase [Bacteroidota bacterium]|nr:3-dehydroquinate synthase [Bacteroidota bacterium]